MTIGLDMMGGDFAPLEAVKGALQYLQQGDQPATLVLIGDESKLDPLLARELAEQGQEDAELNKQMIKANVDKQLAGCHGQNCW